jgi:hypothetical protein
LGDHFTESPTLRIKFGTQIVYPIKVRSAKSLLCRTPSNPSAEPVKVFVANEMNTWSTSDATFTYHANPDYAPVGSSSNSAVEESDHFEEETFPQQENQNIEIDEFEFGGGGFEDELDNGLAPISLRPERMLRASGELFGSSPSSLEDMVPQDFLSHSINNSNNSNFSENIFKPNNAQHFKK